MAYDKIKMVHKGEGITAFGVVYRWFTDVSGLRLAEQARMLMHPSPPKRQEDLVEHVEMWHDRMRRLEAHGEKFNLAPLCKINTLRMLTAGKTKAYFDWREADHDPTNAKKTHEELLNEVKDYARRRKLSTNAKERMQQERDHMDVEAVAGLRPGRQENCGSTGHASRERPQPYKGKGKGKDSKENAATA